MQAKKIVLWAAVVVLLLALDWAALHDILKGEPDTYAEYAMVLLSLATFAAMALIAWKQRRPGI